MKNKDKSKIRWLIGIGIFALIGIAAFLIGYGLRDGWEAVLAWFTSRWAYIVYTGAVVYVVALLCYIHIVKVSKEMK